MSEESKNAALGCIVVLIGIAVLFVLFGFKIISPSTVATVTRFGTFEGVAGEGIVIDPLGSYNYYSLKTQAIESEEAAATKDMQDINLRITFNFSLLEAGIPDIYLNIGSQAELVRTIIRPRLSQYIKAITTGYDAENILLNRNEVVSEVVEQLKTDEVLIQYINVGAISITNLEFMNMEYNAAIDAKQVAQQKVKQVEYELEEMKLEAEKQRVQQETLTDKILLKMWIEKWDGRLPSYTGADDMLLPFNL